jgi:multidrug efflux system outer membrane protein
MTRVISILAMCIAAAGLAGCAVGPDYHQPKTDTPGQWSSAMERGETNSAGTAEATWWKSFSDPELDSLIARACESNLTVRIAVGRVREARAEAGLASAGLWPTADAAASYDRERLSQNGFPSFPPGIPLGDNVYQAGFDAAWELDVFGGLRRAKEAAGAEAAAAEFGRRAVLISVYGEVARNYIEARAYQRRLAVTRDNIKTESDTLDLTRDLNEHGLRSDLDVQQATALLAATQADVPSLENGFETAAHDLAVLLGQPPGAIESELTNAEPIPAEPPSVPVGLPSDLLQRRPDIGQAERLLAAATANIGVAKSDWFPKFSLTGDIALQSISTADWFTAGSRLWTVGPTAQWRLFDAGRIRANVHIQTARQEEALAGYEQTVLSAFEDVENALTTYAKEQVRRESLARSRDASRKALDLAKDLYGKGLTDYLHVLDAERDYDQSEDALVLSEADVSLDLVSLYKALGGGWERPPDNSTAAR